MLSYKNGMVFIQTDKPVYTPNQNVKIRVIPLEFDMTPSNKKVGLLYFLKLLILQLSLQAKFLLYRAA